MLYYNFLPTTFATYLNEIFYLLQRFGIFFLFEKENACKRKANSGLRPETPRTPRRSTWLVLLSRQLGTFARKLASLKQYGLVRLAKQAVPSQFSVRLYHCGEAIGGLFLKVYKVACFTFFVVFSPNFRFAVPYTQKSYPRGFPRVGSLFYYAYKPAGVILKVGRSLGDLLHGDLFFSELTLILILIVVLGFAVEGAVGGNGYYRAAAL